MRQARGGRPRKAATIDVLINFAGFFPIVRFEEMSATQWRQVIDINLTGPFLLTKAVLPLMKSKGWGRIINFGSGSMFEGVDGQTHYVAAKAGIVGFSRSLAREVGKYGITVNVIKPGLTVSPPSSSTSPLPYLRHNAPGAPSAATRFPKTWSEPRFSWHRPMPLSFPVRPSVLMAARPCTNAPSTNYQRKHNVYII
ncbi:SDR family NAD(P)-dependent oxidoreductase [Massilia sp. CMS3.1]|uniref:SDR family NAD(P)-dependent oxidoreductase n=1 Tax=Massilia sp. CMS3.1 TaxID=3373083 RepID=UPI003EE57706